MSLCDRLGVTKRILENADESCTRNTSDSLGNVITDRIKQSPQAEKYTAAIKKKRK